jgi:hypothetical protein
MLSVVLTTMREMQSEQLREMREMVLSILQGRPMDEAQLEAIRSMQPEPQPSRMPYDPPDYDAPGTDDLPPGLQAVFQREEVEQDAVRLLRTEQEVLAQQLDEARAAILDPQGPVSDPSSLMG